MINLNPVAEVDKSNLGTGPTKSQKRSCPVRIMIVDLCTRREGTRLHTPYACPTVPTEG